MAQTLEKNFLQKIRDMPSDEIEIQPPSKAKGKKGSKRVGGATMTRKQTMDAQVITCKCCNCRQCNVFTCVIKLIN